MNEIYANVDAVCTVLALHRSRNIIDLVLTTFIPAYEDLKSDYASLPDDPSRTFTSADEIKTTSSVIRLAHKHPFGISTKRTRTESWLERFLRPTNVCSSGLATALGYPIITRAIWLQYVESKVVKAFLMRNGSPWDRNHDHHGARSILP